jgi:hypothetical protein
MWNDKGIIADYNISCLMVMTGNGDYGIYPPG